MVCHIEFLWHDKKIMKKDRRGVSVFSAPAKYRVVKIACSSFKVVLWIMKRAMNYPSLDPSLEVITLYPAIW
jgi:hypothetical protein